MPMGMQPGMGLMPPRPAGMERSPSVGLVGLQQQQQSGMQAPPGGPLSRAVSGGSAGLAAGGLNGRMTGFPLNNGAAGRPGGGVLPPPSGYSQQAGNDIMVLIKQGAQQQQQQQVGMLPGQLGASAQQMFGGGGYEGAMGHDGSGAPFSLSEFPSLASSRPGSGSGMLGGVDMAAALELYGAGKGHHSLEFSMQSEDFPALSGGLGGPGSKPGSGGPKPELGGPAGFHSSLDDGLSSYDGAGTGYGLPGGASPPPQAGPGGYTLGGRGGQMPGGRGLPGAMRGPGLAPAPVPSPAERFGLLGLLSAIRMSDVDLSTLALGTDLTTLGLNLNAPEPLYKTFASPWADAPCRPEPDLGTPACYLQQPPHLSAALFGRLSPECLLYIFYSSPGEDLQLAAAEELAQRGWLWHKDLKAWLQRAPGAEPPVKLPNGERGSYLFFDVNTWERMRKDAFVLDYAALDETPRRPQR
jgi:CCR4-NOT transcription complex subunit 2